MIHETIDSFATVLVAGRPLLGLDLGTKTIGLALSDRLLMVATPQHTIARVKFSLDAAALLAFAQDRAACGLVLGLPINMDGTEGARAQSTRAFARNLVRMTDLPITYWDERLSTVAAERALIDADMSRKKRNSLIDHVAASFILQGALDRLRNLRSAA